MPLLVYDLTVDTISNFATLYAPVVRCALDDCGGSGWVFVSWYAGGTGGHATAFFFDGEDQVGFDASRSLKRYADLEGTNAWSFEVIL